MATRVFIDTNILIYAEASDQPHKQRLALDLIRHHFLQASGVISTQVLQEYCNVAIKKLKLPVQHIRAQLEVYAQLEVIQVTPSMIHSALDLHQTRRFSFFDAVIIASAQVAGCAALMSEDLGNGELIGGVRIINPFVEVSSNTSAQ